ncbi:PRP4_2 [Sanghuangporus weigelae]
MPAGLSTQKRLWDGTSITRGNGNLAKRSREDDPRDWKDVYLNGSSRGRQIKMVIDQTHGEILKDIERENGIEIIVTGSVAMYHGVVVMMTRVVRDVRPVTDNHESEREEGEISPAASRSSTPAPPQLSTTISTRNSSSSPAQLTRSTTPLTTNNNVEFQMELDLETETTSKPVEETIAERRARRQVIRAKYAGIASAAVSTNERASQSPGPSSAVSQPPPSASEANLASKDHSSVAAIPHLTDEKTIKSVDAGTYPPFIGLFLIN